MSCLHDKLASGRSELRAEASPQRCQIDCLVVGDGDWMLHNRTEDVESTRVSTAGGSGIRAALRGAAQVQRRAVKNGARSDSCDSRCGVHALFLCT